jgi:CRP-like cAMP-binding protein
MSTGLSVRSASPLRRLDREPQMSASDAVKALDRLGVVVTFHRDQSLFYEGDRAEFYFKVVSGAVRSCKLLPDGRRHVGDFFLAGDFIGLEAAISYIFSAEAITDTTLVRYSRRSVDALAAIEPRVGRRLLDIACHGLSAAKQQMVLLSRKTAEERIASFVLGMAERNGTADCVALPMTRTDIGDHLGLTMETVSRAFSQLKSDGVLELKNSREVTIRNRDALEALAEAA